MKDCQRPPKGWICTRAEGHEGPCAADTFIPRQHLAQALNAQYGHQLEADDIRDLMVINGVPQVQATVCGFTDWYTFRHDAARRVVPGSFTQLPF